MYHHARSGLNLTLFRAYDARLGRWLSRDPLGESAGVNIYAYVDGNPINLVDPLGALGITPSAKFTNTATLAGGGGGFMPSNVGMSGWDIGGLGGGGLSGVGGMLGGSLPIGNFGRTLGNSSGLFKQTPCDNAPRMVNPRNLLPTENPSKSALASMTDSMKQRGFDPANPITVTQFGNKLVIVDGNTRAAAAMRAGITEVPVRVINVSDSEAASLADAAARLRNK